MLASAAAQAGASLFQPARAGSFTKREGSTWVLEVVQDGEALTLAGRMLVDATGRKAVLASRLGGKAEVADRLIGAVAFSEKSETAQWTLIEAAEEGWWYSVPLPGAGMVFAYMTDSDLWLETARKWDELLRLAPLTFERAGCRQIPPPSQIVSAASVVRRPVTGPDWMAIGDAALAYDPLSGQGVFKSIETGTRCASAIARYFDGELNALSAYETWADETYRSYLSLRAQYYSSVVRWNGSRFWKRRMSSS
jgi:flavin-dependent dehydrogenase